MTMVAAIKNLIMPASLVAALYDPETRVDLVSNVVEHVAMPLPDQARKNSYDLR